MKIRYGMSPSVLVKVKKLHAHRRAGQVCIPQGKCAHRRAGQVCMKRSTTQCFLTSLLPHTTTRIYNCRRVECARHHLGGCVAVHTAAYRRRHASVLACIAGAPLALHASWAAPSYCYINESSRLCRESWPSAGLSGAPGRAALQPHCEWIHERLVRGCAGARAAQPQQCIHVTRYFFSSVASRPSAQPLQKAGWYEMLTVSQRVRCQWVPREAHCAKHASSPARLYLHDDA